MMTVEITGTPTLDSVITVADLKEHLRVDHSDEDTLITSLRAAAISWIEDYCNTRLGDVTAVGYLDFFYNARFPVGPVNSITSVTYTDANGDTQTLAAAKYWYDIKTKSARITFDNVPQLYDDTFHAVQINMNVGYAEADVPEPVLHAIRLLVGHLYENRQQVTRTKLNELPLGIHSLVSPYRNILAV
jgi:uncharacterized phiE125 gp8 family phage protein